MFWCTAAVCLIIRLSRKSTGAFMAIQRLIQSNPPGQQKQLHCLLCFSSIHLSPSRDTGDWHSVPVLEVWLHPVKGTKCYIKASFIETSNGEEQPSLPCRSALVNSTLLAKQKQKNKTNQNEIKTKTTKKPPPNKQKVKPKNNRLV